MVCGSELKESKTLCTGERIWATINENGVKIVTELIAQKDATAIVITSQEVRIKPELR